MCHLTLLQPKLLLTPVLIGRSSYIDFMYISHMSLLNQNSLKAECVVFQQTWRNPTFQVPTKLRVNEKVLLEVKIVNTGGLSQLQPLVERYSSPTLDLTS